MPDSRKLKVLRHAHHISVRQVEQASRRIAAAKGDKRFCVSNGWLTQLEKGGCEPGICKLFSLSVIYHVKFCDLIRLYDIDINEIEKYEPVANPHNTQLLANIIQKDDSPPSDIELLRSALRSSPTRLLPGKIEFGKKSVVPPARHTTIYGYIGLNDFTMYPMIRPGSLVQIDTSQSKLERVGRPTEYDRPIYFIEIRDAFVCGWCELQGKELLLIPHYSSPATIRRFEFLKDAEIIGRVIAFDTRCVDEDL